MPLRYSMAAVYRGVEEVTVSQLVEFAVIVFGGLGVGGVEGVVEGFD